MLLCFVYALSDCSAAWLSYHMKKEFPDVIFHKPHKATESLIVACKNTALRDLIVDEESINAIEAFSTTSAEETTSANDESAFRPPDAHSAELYHSSLLLY